jgi:pimeloyl-ACP methyl ester carboxylesterase
MNKNNTLRYYVTPLVALMAVALFSSCSDQPPRITPKQVYSAPPAYDYPINNPYAATIIGMPPKMKVDYSAVPKAEDESLMLFPDRDIPEGFWYDRGGLHYAQLLQSTPAPVVYVIPGTGGDIHSENMRTLTGMLYTAGFSVVLLPSPTHPDFILNASRNFIVGRPPQDAQDLYRAMTQINARIAAQTTVTGTMLIGYSLGAMDAAYTAKLDDAQGALHFRRVMLINPPWSLYSSMHTLDTLLYSALPGGINEADRFLKSAIRRLSSVNQSADALDFQNERVLLDAYQKYKPSDRRLSTTIGISFRLAAANMIFTSDVMCHCGYIFPKNAEFTTSTPLNDYFAVAIRTSFRNYFDDIYTDTFRAENPGLTKQELIDEGSFAAIAPYIENHPKIGMITNADDIILAPGELNKLKAVFGRNATVYPNGGHMGNLGDPAVAYHIVQFLTQREGL